ncbi:hypothetical protein LCGC14_1185090 [marine sediment metagenome]|uniref:Uncharacterized protein n=1 Tax=marine sediment metagenome TaxID=412755 RepID=A0A0F9PRF9_9ZZZZ
MKKIDLNIKVDEPVKGEDKKDMSAPEVAIRWIGIMVERALNKPEPKTGRPTLTANMDVQRKYFKLMDALDKHKDGIAELEDDVFQFLDRKFHQAEIAAQLDVTKLLVYIENAINKAKVEANEK